MGGLAFPFPTRDHFGKLPLQDKPPFLLDPCHKRSRMPQFKCLLSIAEWAIEKMKGGWLYNSRTRFWRLGNAITRLPLWHTIITLRENKSKHILPITADTWPPHHRGFGLHLSALGAFFMSSFLMRVCKNDSCNYRPKQTTQLARALLRALSPVSFFVARLLLPFYGDPSHTFAGPHQGNRHEDHTLLKDWARVPWRRAGLWATLKINIESKIYLLPHFDLRNMLFLEATQKVIQTCWASW